jgi:hypothetical protein
MHSSGKNLIDAAARGESLAKKEANGVGSWLKKTVANPVVDVLALTHPNLMAMTPHVALGLAPLAAAGYGIKKGVDAAGKALGRRNVAIAPAVSNAIHNVTDAGRRWATSAGSQIAHTTHDPLKNLVHTFASPEAEQWYSQNMPSWAGGHAAGGRIAYKKGGAVNSRIEPLVQNLMSRYKAVKKSQDNGTKPLLEQPDQAIVKALNVAQKAI